jgi:hypothetical protein
MCWECDDVADDAWTLVTATAINTATDDIALMSISFVETTIG